jgi:hypothetical protein
MLSHPHTCCCSIAEACGTLLLLLLLLRRPRRRQVAATAAAVGAEGTGVLCRAVVWLLWLLLWPFLWRAPHNTHQVRAGASSNHMQVKYSDPGYFPQPLTPATTWLRVSIQAIM